MGWGGVGIVYSRFAQEWFVLNAAARTLAFFLVGSARISGSARPLPSAMSHACSDVTRSLLSASCHGLAVERASFKGFAV